MKIVKFDPISPLGGLTLEYGDGVIRLKGTFRVYPGCGSHHDIPVAVEVRGTVRDIDETVWGILFDDVLPEWSDPCEEE